MITVKVINSNINKRDTIETDATTWGGLKVELEDAGLASGDYQGVVKQTSTALALDGADLPDEDFTLFVIVKKSKAGNDYRNWSFIQQEDDASSTSPEVTTDLASRLEAIADRMEAFLDAVDDFQVEDQEEERDPNVPTEEEMEYARMLEEQL